MQEIIEFRSWKKWVADFGRCQATTKNGHQCRKKCAGWGSDICGYDDFDTVEFILGETDRCRMHCHKPERSRT